MTGSLKIAADIGGTFTDLALFLPDGRLATKKVPSTPADAATGSAYARMYLRNPAPSNAQTVWLVSNSTPSVSGKTRVYANAFIRANVSSVHLELHQFDSANTDTVLVGPSFTPGAWAWNNYRHRVSATASPYTAAFTLKPGTVKVTLAIVASTWSGVVDNYVDVDTVSMSAK